MEKKLSLKLSTDKLNSLIQNKLATAIPLNTMVLENPSKKLDQQIQWIKQLKPENKINQTLKVPKVQESPEEMAAKENTANKTRKVSEMTPIYKELHAKFPNVINLKEPKMFAKGIFSVLMEELGITEQLLNKFLKWYIRLSNYYDNHQVGTPRYQLDGTIDGYVTEEDVNRYNLRQETIATDKSNLEQNKNSDK